jgi:hypothetical protein
MFKFFHFQQGNDSWKPMFAALKYLQSNHQNSVYSELFFIQGVKFQYPLTSLLPLFFIHSHRFLSILSWLALITTVIFCIKIFNLSLKANTTEEFSDFDKKFNPMLRNLVLLCLGITFYPTLRAYTLGQVQVFINLFFSLATWFWLNGKGRISGFWVGLMILFKPQYVLILFWGLLRRKWSFSVAVLITTATSFLLSILIFGLPENLAYLNVLKFISQHGEAYYPNQSMNGLLNRLLLNADSLNFNENGFPPFNPIVYYGTVLSSLLLISLALAGFIRSDKQGSAIDFLNIALTCTIASPVAWEHHYGILLPIYAFLLPLLMNQPVLGKSTIFYFGLSYFLTSNLLNSTNIFAGIPGLNILQSYLFVAALIVLLVLNRLAYCSSGSCLTDKSISS